MERDPFHGDLKRLQANPSGWPRRVGNYRIIYDVYFEQRLIVIAGIVRRTSTTY
jgi:mRNA-degrading endonuclease RelE of RelBE toxin-antitoxin system